MTEADFAAARQALTRIEEQYEVLYAENLDLRGSGHHNVRDLAAERDGLKKQLETLRAAAQGFIDTMIIRHSDAEGREVPWGYTQASNRAAIALYDALRKE